MVKDIGTIDSIVPLEHLRQTPSPSTLLGSLFFDLDEKQPLPIIRMVFAFGSPSAAVRVIPQYVERPPGKAKTEAREAVQKSPCYTSYDIWCTKASSETFGIIPTRLYVQHSRD